MAIPKLSIVIPVLALSFFISGCEEPAQQKEAASRPVKTIIIGGDAVTDMRTFPAVVDAIQKAEVSFRVSGKIQNVLVKEGAEVKEGQLLAELDPTDFDIRLKDRMASYNTAKANFDRAVDLVDKGAISRVDHDNIRAKYRTAEANLAAAKQDLLYTRLRASFSGSIAKRHVENFEEVGHSQVIFSLQDVSALKIKIDVPENLMMVVNRHKQKEREIYAVFENINEQKFPLSFLEIATKGDPKTRTFRVTLKMDAPEKYTLLPGMTATVSAELFADESGSDATVEVPVSAVVADNKKQATVWVVDEKSLTVSPVTVTPGFLFGDTMQVAGLNHGDRIVVAGAHFLRNNMKVSLLQTGEQAQ